MISVSVLFPDRYNLTPLLKNRDPSFPSLLVPYHGRVSRQSATLVLLDCLCMDSCGKYIHANFPDGEICVINYYTSRISMNDDYAFVIT